MTRIVTQPKSPAATKAADQAAYAVYPIIPSPGDANYGEFQKLWMDTYIANGGKYTTRPPAEEQAAVKKAREASKGNKSTAGATQECPKKTRNGPSGQTTAAKSGSGTGSGKDFKPGETPCTCKVDKLLVKCSHGRAAKNGLLQIVPKSLTGGYVAHNDGGSGFIKGGDEITITPKASGSKCGSKLIIRTTGFSGSAPTENIGSAALSRTTKAPVIANASFAPISSPSKAIVSAAKTALGWWKASPSVAYIETSTCTGNSKLVRVEHYPMGETTFAPSFSEILGQLMSGFKRLPLKDHALFTQKGTARKKRKDGNAKSEDFTVAGLRKRALKGIQTTGVSESDKDSAKQAELDFKVAMGWKEEDNTNLAYCEIAAIVEADPLFSLKTEFLLYGIPIPKLVRDYCNVAAGFFVVIDGKIALSLKVIGKKYPLPKDKWEKDSIVGELSGSLKFELKAELIVFSPKAIQITASGSSGAKVSAIPKNHFDSKIILDSEISVGGLKTKVVFKAAWGLFDKEREWHIFEPWKIKDEIETVSFG